ncbi:MAG: hypothetical protein VX278_08055 [Myxococcota bacterium]|nr:hypothetical protein [Myxococcota bacterium]
MPSQSTTSVFLALGLGSALTLILHQNADATGFQSVGYGQNPVVAIGGTAYDGETKSLLTAPTTHDLIVTDVTLTSTGNGLCIRSHKSDLMTSSGSVLGQFETTSGGVAYGMNGSTSGAAIQMSMVSGLRIPAGEELQLVVVQSATAGNNYCGSATSYGVRYMVSGYYAQP